MQDDYEIEIPQDGVTRRDLFRMGNALAIAGALRRRRARAPRPRRPPGR